LHHDLPSQPVSWLVSGVLCVKEGIIKEDVSEAPRVRFWGLGRVSLIKLMAAIGVIEVIVGIAAGTMSG